MENPNIIILDNMGDQRGASYKLPHLCLEFLGAVRDAHPMTLKQGSMRGNHFHQKKLEVLIVLSQGNWLFAWEQRNTGNTTTQKFNDVGTAAIMIPAGCAHAIRNDGNSELVLLELTNMDFDSASSDCIRREILPVT